MKTHFLAMTAAIALAGCGDPFGGMDRLSDVSGVGGAATANVAATDVDGTLLSEAGEAVGPVERAAVDEAATRAAAPRRGGLFGLFGGGGAEARPAAAPQGLGGLFGGGGGSPDIRDVEPGTVLPYGTIGRVCNLPRNRRGTRVAAASGFQVYDTIPNSTAPRPHYITGFSDNCARIFTGALVMTGDVGTHEAVRYLQSNSDIAYTETDNAYEAIKSRVCRVSRGQPCGSRIDQLDRNTTFLTVYESFGGGARWVEILLHDRGVAAIDFKS